LAICEKDLIPDNRALGYWFDGLLFFFNLFSSQPLPKMRIHASKPVQCPDESDELLGTPGLVRRRLMTL
jgi:hypothetical protein